jgi:hypothetical protein
MEEAAVGDGAGCEVAGWSAMAVGEIAACDGIASNVSVSSVWQAINDRVKMRIKAKGV